MPGLKEEYDKTAKMTIYKPGDMALSRLSLRSSKLDVAWDGPFEVVEVPSDAHVVLGVGKGYTQMRSFG